MASKTYIYLILSEDSPRLARLLRAALPPIDVAEVYEQRNPGWYVKRVWSVPLVADVASVMASVIAAHPGRSFEPEDWSEEKPLAVVG